MKRGFLWATDWRDDLRFAVRSFARNPGVTVAVVVVLGLGIGANTTLFSVIDQMLLRDLPGLDAQHELVAVFSTGQARGSQETVLREVSHGDYLDFEKSGAFSGLAAFSPLQVSLTLNGPSERAEVLAASANYFDVLGVRPARGRFFAVGDFPSQGELVAVVSYRLWQRRFGSDPAIVGRAIHLNGQPVTVIGVAPKNFRGTSKTTSSDLWITFDTFRSIAVGIYAQFHGAEDRHETWLELVGRKAPGLSQEEVQNALDVIASGLAQTYPETHATRGVQVSPLSEVVLGAGNRQRVARYSGVLLGLVAAVLLVACLDVASLLLARANLRRQEMAIRRSLGAGQGRVMRMLLVESLLLAMLGGVLGLAITVLSLPLVEQLRLPVHVELDLGLDMRLAAFACGVSVLCGLLFGLVPAYRSSRFELVSALRGEKSLGRGLRFGLTEALVIVQVALALVVLIGSGLMIRTLRALDGVELGYRPDSTLTVTLDLAAAGYEGPRVTTFYEELTQHLRELPGAQSASMASALPMVGANMMVNLVVSAEGAAPVAEGDPPRAANHAIVGRDYFRTVDMKLIEGRDFSMVDTPSSAGVVIVNATLAKQFWPDRSAVGQRLSVVQTEELFEVIGMVADAKYAGVKEEDAPVLYLYHAQQEKSFLGRILASSMTLLVRAEDDARRLLPGVRSTVQAMDPYLPVFNVNTLPEILSESVAIERQMATLMSAFGLLAMFMMMVGLYGVISQAVGRRSKEIAIRMACGARPASVLGMMLGRSTVLSLMGVIAGLLGSVLASRAMAGYLFGVTPNDPWVYAGISFGLMTLTVMVSSIPASRATRIDPIEMLRKD